MSKETHEHISCLMDGEISRETSRFLVRRLGADEQLSATWARYHLVRDCLRHQDGGIAHDDLCSRVNRAIENDTQLDTGRRLPMGWLKPAAGLAIAASVALMAIFVVTPGAGGLHQADGSASGTAQVESFTSPQIRSTVPVSRQANLSGQAKGEQRMQSYLLRHYQATGSAGGKGFVTFVPIVGTSAVQTVNTAQPNSDSDSDTDKSEEFSAQ